MTEKDKKKAESTEVKVVPKINPDNHAVENELWKTLELEVEKISKKIKSGVELKPKDIKNVRSLRRQVEDYVKEFNRSMRAVQQDYKEQVSDRLDTLGYPVIEQYVLEQREKQTSIQNKRSSDKLKELTKIVEEEVAQTISVKQSALKSEMLPAFLERFPIINSGAESKMISDWKPYKQVIKTNLAHVDTFLSDEKFKVAQILPIHSKTMQQLLQYIRSGDIDQLSNMEAILKSDRAIIENEVLKKHIQSHDDAINMIKDMVPGDKNNQKQTLVNISKIITLALTLEN